MKLFQPLTLLALAMMGVPLMPAAGQPAHLKPAAKGRPRAALITVIKSPVSWSPDGLAVSHGGWRLLPKSSQPRELHAGEQVRCGPGGVAELLLPSGKVAMTSGQQLTIVNVPPVERAALDAALGTMLATAGNPRDMTPRFVSPLAGDSDVQRCAVSPDTFAFEWLPFPHDTTLTLTLRGTTDGPPLWQEAGIPGETGRFVSPGARAALARRQEAGDAGPLVLEVLPTGGSPFQVTFSVLSEPRERSLRQALAVWASAPSPLMRHLGRASVFYGDALYPESAAEYDAARRLAPDSLVLRRRAAEAYRMYQNLGRAYALEPPQTKRASPP